MRHIPVTTVRSSVRRGLEQAFGACAVLAAIGVPTLGQAQERAATESESGMAEVAVTATRIQRSGFTAPTPTTMLGSEDRELRATVNVAALLNELPSVRPAAAALTSQNTGIQAINLRGLNGNNNASTRTLVLVDGRRFVPTTLTGVVDSNVVPSSRSSTHITSAYAPKICVLMLLVVIFSFG